MFGFSRLASSASFKPCIKRIPPMRLFRRTTLIPSHCHTVLVVYLPLNTNGAQAEPSMMLLINKSINPILISSQHELYLFLKKYF